MRKKSIIIIGLVLVLLAVVYIAIPNKRDSLIHDMVELDQYYIPVLAYTSQDKPRAARSAMDRLLPLWSEFRQDHRGQGRRDSEWAQDMEKLDGYIQHADELISDGKELQKAHDSLEHVRIILMNARDRNHIDYYIDHLTRYHEPMETLVLSVKGKSPDELSDETIASMRSQLGTAQYLWKQLEQAEFDRTVYEFSEAKARELKALVSKETQSLSNLQEALDSMQRPAIIKAGLALKPPFAKAFMMFGEFGEQE